VPANAINKSPCWEFDAHSAPSTMLACEKQGKFHHFVVILQQILAATQ
jgi:hypothetical protein